MPVKPCRPDQYRNPETGRCKKISTRNTAPSRVGNPKPCKPGQFRNPVTNRCKKIAQPISRPTSRPASRNLKPCKPHQFRNPVTNRCKNKTPFAEDVRPVYVEANEDELDDEFDDEDEAEDVLRPFDNEDEAEDVPSRPADVEANEDEFDNQNFNSSKKFARSIDNTDLCTGHAMALARGGTVSRAITPEEHKFYNWYKDSNGVRPIFADFPSIVMALMDTSARRNLFPRYMVYNHTFNITGHSTILNLFSPDGKNATLWYYDPQIGSAWREQHEWFNFDAEHSHKPWFREIQKTTDVKQVFGDDGSFNHPEDLEADFTHRYIYFYKHIIAAWKNSSRYEEIKQKFDVWRRVREEQDEVELGEDNIMSALYILSLLLNADHLRVASIYESTPMVGPQDKFDDGICHLNKNKEQTIKQIAGKCGGYGACAVWTSIYALFAESFSRKLGTATELIAFMKNNPLVGEKSALDLLGKAVTLHYVDTTSLKPFTAQVFEHVPTFSTVRQKDIYLERLTDLYGDIAHAAKTIPLRKIHRSMFLHTLADKPVRSNVVSGMAKKWTDLVEKKISNDTDVLPFMYVSSVM